MPQYWMISNRNLEDDGLGSTQDRLRYWTTDGEQLTKFANWGKPLSAAAFKTQLLEATKDFPLITDPADHQQQKHVVLYIHGFNNTWDGALVRYQELCKKLFSGPDGMGICVLFSWPSDGMATNYLPDRRDAVACAQDLADVFTLLYDYLEKQQMAAEADAEKACRAKLSVIAHSMGNFVLQKAMQVVWTRKNRPLLVSLLNQLLMVAADVDNDLFDSGEAVDGSDGDAIANLTYRVSALFSGRDAALGLSAGMKHFGKRRLGRSGLDRVAGAPPDNVWDLDCTAFFEQLEASEVHTAYFTEDKVLTILGRILTGLDRQFIVE